MLSFCACVPGRSAAAAAAAAKSLQLCPTVCDPIDGSPPGSPVPGILQARTLEWVAISFSNALKWKVKSESEVTQSCPTLSDPMDYSLLRLLRPWHFPGKSTGVGCHSLLRSSHSVVSDSLRPHGLQPTRLLHPWDFPGKSTGVECHCLLKY